MPKEPITRTKFTATVPFSQGITVPLETINEPNTLEQVLEQPNETQENTEQQKLEQPVEESHVTVIDFTYGRSLSTSFCMRCGGQAAYFGKSVKLNFSKKLCAECVAYYSNTLNV